MPDIPQADRHKMETVNVTVESRMVRDALFRINNTPERLETLLGVPVGKLEMWNRFKRIRRELNSQHKRCRIPYRFSCLRRPRNTDVPMKVHFIKVEEGAPGPI